MRTRGYQGGLLFALGVAGLTVLALFASGLASVPKEKAPEVRSTDLVLPFLRDGAGGSYAYFSDEWSAGDKKPAHFESNYAFRVRNATMIIDEAGKPHATVAIEDGWKDANGGWDPHFQSFFDVANRTFVRFDKHIGVYGLFGGAYWHSAFPSDRGFGNEGELGGPDLFVVMMQGSHYPCGTEFGIFSHLPHPTYAANSLMGTPVTSQRRVTVGCPAWDKGMNATLVPVHDTYAVAWRTSDGGSGRDYINNTYWFDGVSAFPAHFVYDATYLSGPGPGGMYGHALHESKRIAYAPGNRTIAWGTLDVQARPAIPKLERTSVISSGTGWGGYSIDDARVRVEGDLTLARFRAWRVQNPGNLLVGGNYDHQPADGEPAQQGVQRWVLVYATPGRTTAFSVSSVLAAGVPVQSDINSAGLFELPASATFQPGDVPVSWITLGQAMRQWDRIDTNVTGLDPDWFQWGYGYYAHQEPAALPDSSRPGASFLRYMGMSRQEPAASATGVPQVVVRQVEMESDTGRITSALTSSMGATPDKWLGSLDPSRSWVEPRKLPQLPGAALPAVVGVAGFSLALLAYIAARRLPWALLFSRFAPEETTGHPMRAQFMEYIQLHPATSAPILRKELQVAWSTTVYHLSVLEKAGQVSSVRDGRHRRYFVAKDATPDRVRQQSALQNATTRAAYVLIVQTPGIERSQIARQLGISRPSVTWHMQRLEAAGLIGLEKKGTKATYKPQVASRGALDAAQL